MLFPYADRGKQGADPDSGCSQIVDFVNLQGSINFVGIRQDLSNLICCDCIQSAAERIQLDQIQIIHCFHIICRSVEPGMVHPLVHDLSLIHISNVSDESSAASVQSGNDGISREACF